ncbi:RDD family protein [Streptomyces griseofuscus]|uniref:RDD family protein n=1 Tax=Streptomyces griseofuscus TaxID=146922 RepID=UPI0036796785
MRRVFAWGVDFGVIVLFAWLLGELTARRVVGYFTEATGLVRSGAWELLTGHWGDLGRTAQLLDAMWHQIAVLVVEAFALLVAGAFVYHWVSLVLFRRTPGMVVAGLEVVSCTRRAAVVRAAASTVADVACFALAYCLLVWGAFAAAFTVWLLSVIVFWANVLPALSGSGRSVADRLAGTTVVRRLRY